MVNGFLESGKTTFIQNAILRDPGMDREKVLIVCCEEGELEYEDLPDNISVHLVEDKTELDDGLLRKLRQMYSPTIVIFEYNIIWGMDIFYKLTLPEPWVAAEQLSIIDAENFGGYFANMRSIFADMLRNTFRVFINRCTRQDDFKFYKDSVKACAPRAELIYLSDREGVLDIMLEEDLPYNINDPTIRITEENFLTWYIDMLDNKDRYEGKTVEFEAIAAKPDHFRKGYLYAGNDVMTCCEDDMQFLGFLCRYKLSENIDADMRIRVKGVVHNEFAPEYGSVDPVIEVTELEKIDSAL